MSKGHYRTVPVIEFCICDDDEGMHHADDRLSFEDTKKTLWELRIANPDIEYTLIAEIDA